MRKRRIDIELVEPSNSALTSNKLQCSMVFRILAPWLSKVASWMWVRNVNPQLTEDDLETFVHFCLFVMNT